MRSLLASVVVPLYNDHDTIGACLQSLAMQTVADRLEIVVVDDGSTDDSAALAAQRDVRLLRQPNAGPAAARNTGAAAAAGPVVLFLDADCVVPPGWAESLLAPFAGPDVVAAVGAIESATPHALAQLIQVEIEERYRLLSRKRHVDFFASVAVAIRRDYFASLGGFRADFLYNEDVELAYRIHREGGKIVFAPAVRALHPHPVRWPDYARTKFWRGVWRMRLYRLYPRKALADDWTPHTLKLQILLAGAAMALLVAALWRPALAGWALALLAACGSTSPALVRDAWQRGGPALAVWVGPFVIVRALALGAAVVWNAVGPRPKA